MIKEVYKIELNNCNCHPENCNCNDYKITVNGKKIASIFSITEEVQQLVKDANNGINKCNRCTRKHHIKNRPKNDKISE